MNKKIHFLLLLALWLPAPVQASVHNWSLNSNDLTAAREADVSARNDKWESAIQHAAKAKDPVVRDMIAWRRYNAKFGNSTFEEITEFLKTHPNWPEQKKLHERAELLIFPGLAPQKVLDWFADSSNKQPRFRDPLTGRGKMALAEAILGSALPQQHLKDDIQRWLREAWVYNDFTEKDEARFLKAYSALLRREDHIARVDRLLWANNVPAAKRLLDKVGSKHRPLFNARIHLQVYNFGIEEAVNAVSKDLSTNDGLLYDRMRWREKHGKTSGMLELMVQVPPYTSHPREWWPLRRKSIFFLLEKNKPQIAYQLAKQHSFTDDTVGFADGEWLAGWIAFHHLKDPKTAYKHFYQLYKRVETPISAGRAAYWAARASEASGYHDIANQWYAVCTKYPSSFYGQLGAQKLGQQMLPIPPQPQPTQDDIRRYQRNDAVKAAWLLHRLKQYSLARLFLQDAVKYAATPGEKRLIAEFGYSVSRPDYSTYAAKEAVRNQGPLLLDAHYPLHESATIRGIKAPEMALIHAITLQESIFLQDVVSRAGATGLMQLMPATAQGVAKKLGVKYNKSSLTDKAYNVKLGSAYLQELLQTYNGSYVLAIASYNAGPGNVNKWIKANGDPRKMKSTEEVVTWLEKIPFSETQNYVQRVIENLQLYRARLAPDEPAKLQTVHDITR